MAFSPSLSHVVLVITGAVLFYVALTDFKQFKIRNELILVLAGLFVVHALLSGRWVSAHWNLAFAALMFGVMFYFYAQNLMGGGDVKILRSAFCGSALLVHCPLRSCSRSLRRCTSLRPSSGGPRSNRSAIRSASRWHLQSRR